MSRLQTLPDGTKGFDANRPVSPRDVVNMLSLKHQFAVRYVPRVKYHQGDVTRGEIRDITSGGLGLMLVQHVAQEGWLASEQLGKEYGRMAADYAHTCGYATGAMLWCDLESVGNTGQPVIDFCNAWYEQVSIVQYVPGLYVGYQAGLSAKDLYGKLRFHAYWSAYNLNSDLVPAVRGVQLRQLVAHPQDMPSGFNHSNMDIDIIHSDALGGTPIMMFG